MKRNSSIFYWSLQLGAWSIFSAIHVLSSVLVMPFSVAVIANGLFIGGSGFVVSHVLRTLFKKYRLANKSIRSILLPAFALVLAGTMLWEAAIVFVHVAILRFYSLSNISLGSTMFWFYYYLVALSLWSVLYFVFKIVAQRRSEKIERLELALSLKDAQLQNLKWQLNPHFLFNSLNSVRALISEDPERAKDMVTRMSSLLRYALNSSDQKTVSLETEIDAVRTYLELEKIRFESRLHYEIEVPPSCLSLRILPMCLQTLAENAIKHGIAKLPRGGTVRIVAFAEANTLHVKILNSGDIVSPLRYGTGLQNTEDRIKLMFGPRSQLRLQQLEPGLVETQLVLEYGDHENFDR